MAFLEIAFARPSMLWKSDGFAVSVASPEDALVLGTVARYSAQKEPLVLYRALLKALDRLPALHFAHLGAGELSADVDAILEDAPASLRDRIHRTHRLEDTAAFYQTLDGFVLASRYEGLALSALEAASTGLPMILSRCPGNEEFLNTGMNRIGMGFPRRRVGAGIGNRSLGGDETARRRGGVQPPRDHPGAILRRNVLCPASLLLP